MGDEVPTCIVTADNEVRRLYILTTDELPTRVMIIANDKRYIFNVWLYILTRDELSERTVTVANDER